VEIPKGYTEEEVLTIIDKVLNSIASKYSFDIYDAEDIKQEGFIIVLENLKDYEGLGPLEHFIRVVLSARLIDLQKLNYIRINRACSKCKVFNEDCERCKKRKYKQEVKKNLLNPIDIYQLKEEKNTYYNECFLNSLEVIEITDKINTLLPVKYREDYLKLKEGISISKKRREEIEKIITEIIEENE